MGGLQGSLAKGSGAIGKQLIPAAALDLNSQTCLLLEGKPSPAGAKSLGWGPILTTRSFQGPGLQGTKLLDP